MTTCRATWVIFAPLELEIRALCDAFGSSDVRAAVYPDGTQYYALSLPSAGPRPPIQVRIVQLKEQGVLQAAVTATRVIDRCKPRFVVSFGIAGGFVKDDHVSLEDVVVSDAVFYYEPAKEGTDQGTQGTHRQSRRRRTHASESRRQPRLLVLPVSAYLIQTCRRLGTELRGHAAYTIRYGPLASGEKLIADINSATRRVILSLNDKMLAVEMEAAGVAEAVRDATQTPAPPNFIAIKGISDNASQRKHSQAHHRPHAARNAAHFLTALIRTVPIPDDDDDVDTAPIPVDTLQKKAAEFRRLLEPWVHPEQRLDDTAIMRQFLKDPPPVFYHWRLEHARMHWVDFHFLLLLRLLQSLGMTPHLLVSDLDPAMSAASRQQTRQIIEAVLGPKADIHWYQETIRDARKYEQYAQAKGLSALDIDKIRRGLYHVKGVADGNLVLEHWLQFIAWSSRLEGRCVLLHWHRHLEFVTFLTKILVLDSLVISMPDLRIGGALGKFGSPGERLLIEPPGYPSILDWLDTMPPAEQVADLWRYLAVGDDSGAVTDGHVAFLDDRPLLQRAVLGTNGDFAHNVTALLGTLALWNRTFFSGWES